MLKFKTVNAIFLVALILLRVYSRWQELPFLLFGGLILSYLFIQVYGSAVLSAQFFLPVKYKGNGHANAIALTFDDGPIPGKTEQILDILKSHDVPAAFFCIGHRVARHPALAKRIHDAGHLLGNHSYWHGKTFDLQTSRGIALELADTDRAIQEAAGVKPNFFRPPYGVTNPMVARAVRREGYTTIGWSVRSFDTVIKNPASLLSRVTKALQAGDIILLHDYSATTLEILPALLDHIAKLGLRIIRVDQLLQEKAYG